ncbi:MAG TPA: maltose alpha-D-glucosyltransferase [Candidatus Paceibacterota bacterium]|nr:maltose alpha-D-glucosyltransferase [Verrucomicrobiota bacterium]HSA10764.1 maltose alpha-D-glucosyltransferase [Candidatus Paceibacterota bacterium]
MADRNRNREGLAPDPLWYKSGVIYEVHVRSFHDGNGDGCGDFQGLTEKLDYLKDLGVTAVWLLPFYPSPLKDDGYDIADYCAVHPQYGTLKDFQVFLREAHQRGLRVITELVLNHTSDQHQWFQRARHAAPGSRWRDFYTWSSTTDRYQEARIIFKDVETSNWTWDHVAGAYYWHRFFSHQPDLNYDSPDVHEAIIKALDFWLDLGVDGLRLDAVPYLYEQDATNCENLPQTHAFLKRLRVHVDERYEDRMLLAEANQWPEDAVTYFGQGRGDECHMAYHFPLMPRLFMAVRMEDRTPIVDILEQTPPIPETSQWALFLRNHDELTLEMVTDEERDYMYRMYAHVHQARLNLGIRRRLAPLLGNDRKRIELLNGLLLSLPGTPVLYYGDEIGMGDNIYLGDRNGVRTPMQWSADQNAGFSRANPQRLYLPITLDPEYHYEAVNVDAQLRNPHSLLWWMRRVLALRKGWRALGEGRVEFLAPQNRKVLAYILRHEREILLVVANLSRYPQPVQLDLSVFKRRTPVELFGRTPFPTIGELPFLLTLGPHGFYWFSLEPSLAGSARAKPGPPEARAEITVAKHWEEVLSERLRSALEKAFVPFLRAMKWFPPAAKAVKSATLKEAEAVPLGPVMSFLTLWQVEYAGADAEWYLVPLAFAAGSEAARLRRDEPQRVVAVVTLAQSKQRGVLYDALGLRGFDIGLLDLIARRRRLKGREGNVVAWRGPLLRTVSRRVAAALESTSLKASQRHTSIRYGERFVLKLFRRLHWGINPELELGRFFTDRGFPHAPPLAGALEYHRADGERLGLAAVHSWLPKAESGWEYTLRALDRYYERVLSLSTEGRRFPPANKPLVQLARQGIPAEVPELIGTYLESARLLGVRTAELHQALASEPNAPEFAPEPWTSYYQRGLYQTMRNTTRHNLLRLRDNLSRLPAAALPPANRVLEQEPAILKRCQALLALRVSAARIRCHGDYGLKQILHTGKDFMIVDFEGEPGQPVSERRIKRLVLRDVTGMLCSFRYAADTALARQAELGRLDASTRDRPERWAACWRLWTSVAFLNGYLAALGRSPLLPARDEELQPLLEIHLLHRTVEELGDHLTRRLALVRPACEGILQLLHARPAL